jgi:predicted nuclease of restriction endonuclease-like (RecB) superfamily|tara:strand:- start:80 stop:307 length:228 start_codon:yes stop_codon:yes gene_type:complete
MAKKATVKKKVARKKVVRSTQRPKASTQQLLVQLDTKLFQRFADYRQNRKDSRTFPWTVRDVMHVVMTEYLEANK